MKVLDLFSGIGGFSLGLERAGVDREQQFTGLDQGAIGEVHALDGAAHAGAQLDGEASADLYQMPSCPRLEPPLSIAKGLPLSAV